ncbi:TfoX/Sxy family protein [Psychroserpens luteolus]|uniref:TfoX/Sxy family protein n=1 Tax=Psychroserpens luteolus TaxID=2855840 RepID=UPI001E3A659B|nr:TfoX/Sxy family protein [Psychroserpens luteolus]MCD2258877.1 TfoX/Sxy family protein [Psychroserpens luteolus]
MAFNEQLANRIREQLKFFPETFTEKRMFGGLSFLYEGKMTVGIIKEDLAVRIIADKMEVELAKPTVRPMDFTKRPMKEFVYVSNEGVKTETELLHYIELGLEHAKSKL